MVLGLALLAISLLAGACRSAATEAGSGETARSTRPSVDPGPGPMSFSARVRLEPVSDGLDEPIAMASRPMRNQLWIAERAGRVRVITKDTAWDLATAKVVRDGYTLARDAVLDISSLTSTEGERGLLGLAFSSDGRTLFVDHTTTDGDIVIASYAVTDPLDFSGAPTTTTRPSSRSTATTSPPTTSPAPSTSTPGPVARPRIDPSTRRVLLTIDHRDANNHNGGQLMLGPDGYLYIGVGDGGRPSDARNAADPESLLGKILRIDPATTDGELPYAIPTDNPFAESGGAPEVWALGLRNPWRFSFDRRDRDLWIGDVGQNLWEEINRLPVGAGGGADLGWPTREGDQPHGPGATDPEQPSSGSDRASVEPVLTYSHDGGACAVIGGFVYRGAAITALQGVYVYGDHCTGKLQGLLSRNGVALDDHALGLSVDRGSLAGFGQDDQGELYALSTSGTLSVIVGAT
jgi:glucose/arabinose dehydrogenase